MSMRNDKESGNTRKKICKKIQELLFNSLVNWWYKVLVLVWIALKLRCVYECCVFFFFFFFFFCFHAFLEECGYCSMNSSRKCWLFSMNSASVHCLRTHKFHFLSIFSLKMGPTALFTHLKIILLQWFQQ